MSAALTSQRVEQGHAIVLGTAVIMVVVVLLYFPTFAKVVSMWSLSTYEHCWLVVPISIALIWSRRAELSAVAVRPAVAGPIAVLALVALWLVAVRAGVQVVEALAVMLMIPAVFWSVFGTQAVRKILFPLFFLSAAVPVGESLIPPLMRSTADIATGLLGVFGMPALRNGMFLTLPGGEFEVADVCSGLQYLLAGTVASLLFSYLTFTDLRKRTVFVLATVVLLIVANGLRAAIVMYVASATELRVFAGEDHVVFGLVLFAVLLMGIFWIGRHFADLPAEPPSDKQHFGYRVNAVMSGAVIALLAIGPFAWARGDSAPATNSSVAEPLVLEHCGPATAWQASWRPNLVGAAQTEALSFDCRLHRVDVFRAAYSGQTQGREVVNAGHTIWPREWRRYVEQSLVDLDMGGRQATVRQVYAGNPTSNTVIWYWYQVGEEATGSDVRAKWLEVSRLIAGESGDSSLVVVSVEGRDTAEELAAELRQAAVVLLNGRSIGQSNDEREL